jgi:hypothetical protein
MPGPRTAARRRGDYIAIIGDMVGSRKLAPGARAKSQRAFDRLLKRLNDRYAASLAADFSITLGDEFQGVLRESAVIPDLIWDIEAGIDSEFRIGIGFGPLYTAVQQDPSKIDGPAFHNARTAIGKAERSGQLGGVFMGFGDLDPILDGIAHILAFQRSRWTEQQRNIASHLRKSEKQAHIAKKIGITRQTISQHVAAAGWMPYFEAETAFRELLRLCIDQGASLSAKK